VKDAAPPRSHPRLSVRRPLWLPLLTVAVLGWVMAGSALADGTAPSNSDPPSISGDAVVGGVLTADPGAWAGDDPITYSYEWSDGGTDSTDTLSVADVGQYITVTVTATNDAGSASVTTDGYGPVLPLAPAIDGNGAPTITGTAQEGNTLSVSEGSWSNGPTAFGYQWEDCDTSGNNCAAISGATSSSYTLQASDVGSTVLAVVTAANAAGNTPATSVITGPVLPLPPAIDGNGAPTIAGTAQEGDTLSVSEGSWSNGPTAFGYQWEDCDASGNNCAAITGATSSTYKLKASDVGSTVLAVVTAANAGGNAPATSGLTDPVLPAVPSNNKAPVISGTPQQGDTLSVTDNGTWSNAPTGYGYAWEDCSNSSGTSCSAIAGATSNLYTLQASDVGMYVNLIVTASNAGGSTPATSETLGLVLPAAPADTVAPGISGTAQQGDTLTAGTGIWNNGPTGYTYAWQDCTGQGTGCSAIAGATSITYTLQASDVGEYVSVTVTASNSGGSTPVTSASLGPVLPPAPANTQAPAITGTAEQGDTLRVSNGTWNNSPTQYSYAWENCNSAGSNCAAITGATSSSYALSAADIGSTIVCVVTATGPGGSTPASTKKTAVVIASPIPVASQPTTTNLLVTPVSPVANQSVTLIATVTAGTSSTALWGNVTFENGGAAIGGCANLALAPSGLSATVACSTSFPASSAQLTAAFTPTTGSILKASSGAAGALTVGRDSSSTSLIASTSVTVGNSTTYTAMVTPPAARPGPLEPTGSVEFLDDGQPVGSCVSQSLSGGKATCSVSYASAGTHEVSAQYSGDANFLGSSSPAAQVSATPIPTTVLGTITSTMQWQFYYTPRYTIVRALVVTGVSRGATVVVRCHGHGCPFASHTTVLPTGKKCARKAGSMCFTAGSFNVTPAFAGRRLKVGARITVNIVRPNWVGKTYGFVVRSRRGPTIQIGCLAPDGSGSAVGC
jgi:Bacterial Ig-like domain (group 3)